MKNGETKFLIVARIGSGVLPSILTTVELTYGSEWKKTNQSSTDSDPYRRNGHYETKKLYRAKFIAATRDHTNSIIGKFDDSLAKMRADILNENPKANITALVDRTNSPSYKVDLRMDGVKIEYYRLTTGTGKNGEYDGSRNKVVSRIDLMDGARSTIGLVASHEKCGLHREINDVMKRAVIQPLRREADNLALVTQKTEEDLLLTVCLALWASSKHKSVNTFDTTGMNLYGGIR